MINSIEELENIIVGMKQGSGILGLGGLVPSLIYLSDVAEVSTRVAPREGITRYNGQDTVLIQVMRQSGANTVRVAERVKDTLRKIEAEYPHLEFTTITDQSLFISQSISSLASSGMIGALLAVAVLLFFLRNISSIVIIALSIPVSVIASFVLIYLSNLSLNLMTLGGLALVWACWWTHPSWFWRTSTGTSRKGGIAWRPPGTAQVNWPVLFWLPPSPTWWCSYR